MAAMLVPMEMAMERRGEGKTIEKRSKSEEEVAGDGGITERPKTEGEQKRAKPEEEVTERPKTEDEEKRAKPEEEVTERPKTEDEEKRAKPEEEVAGDGGITKRPVIGDGITKRPKRMKLVRFPKEYIEFKLFEQGRPSPCPRMSEERIEELERRYEIPGQVRAEEDYYTAYFQKKIDHYDQMHEQYYRTGYAEIELTDDEGDIDEPPSWRKSRRESRRARGPVPV